MYTLNVILKKMLTLCIFLKCLKIYYIVLIVRVYRLIYACSSIYDLTLSNALTEFVRVTVICIYNIGIDQMCGVTTNYSNWSNSLQNTY